jgi:ABC-type Fe3+ transport system permease subunit
VLRGVLVLGLVAAGGLLILAYGLPGAAILLALTDERAWSDAGLTPRRWGILLRTVAVAAGAALVALSIGAALAVGIVSRRSWKRALTRWLCLVVLLTPPYIYGYAWSLPLLPGGLNVGPVLGGSVQGWLATWGRALLCLGTWLAPVAAWILALGWQRAAAPAQRLARLDAPEWRGLRRAALGALWPWVLLAGSVCTLLALTEYSVCHLCLLQTWNTEVLAAAQGAPYAGAATVLAWPLLVMVAGLVALTQLQTRRLATASEVADQLAADAWTLGGGGAGSSRGNFAIWLVGLAVIGAPFGLLLLQLNEWRAFVTVWQVYPADWPLTLLSAGMSGLFAVILGFGVAALLSRPGPHRAKVDSPRSGLMLIAVGSLTIVGLVLPPAVLGDAFSAAFVQWAARFEPLASVGDHWPVVSLLGFARYAALAFAAAALAVPHRDSLREAAELDGASWVQGLLRVTWPRVWPGLLSAGVLVSVLSLTEVAATQMVRPPNVPNLAVTLLNAIHFGRQDQVIAQCLYVVLLVGAACGGLLAWERWRWRSKA